MKTLQAPQNVQETINWLIRLGRPPLPECPIEAAKQGKEPKQPCFLDGKYLKTVNWKQWQNTQPIEEIYTAWFRNQKTGIGTLGGWNGKHWLGWIDFDQKDFADAQECDRAIAEWLEEYPLMKEAPMFRTPSGGYRFLVAFSQEPKNFKATSGFSLKSDGSHHVGELLSKNGGHTLLPPTIGVTGIAYQWRQWSEYPPVVDQPEDIGLYPMQKKMAIATTPAIVKRDSLSGNPLSDLLTNEIIPRFTLERAFNWQGHDFKQHGGGKLKGSCPWHESKSGTAFYAEIKNGSFVWRCPACDIGGGIVEYRHRLAGGNGSPRGAEFVALIKDLAFEVGVEVPERNSGGDRRVSGTGFAVAQKLPLKEAAQQARTILQSSLDELASNIELETIREACKMNPYDWERKIIKPLKRDLEGDRFKLELLGLLQIDDPVERIRQQALLAPKYQMSSGLIEKAMGAMKQRTQTPEAQAMDLDALFDMETEGLDWLIPGFLPRRETIVLAGSPKAGKTLLAIDMAFCVATGEGQFLGQTVAEGKVLLISVDESAGSTKSKLINRGFRRNDKGKIKTLLSWDISQMAALEKELEDFKPSLVVIDSLRRVNKGSEISENSAEFADNIYTLKETLQRYGASGILIHHTNKDREALGVDQLRGSSAIAGAVWGVLQITQIPKPDPNNQKKLIIDPKDPKRTLSLHARDVEGQQLMIELDPEHNNWIKTGEVGDSDEAQAERETIQARILKLLGTPAHASGLSGNEILSCLDAGGIKKSSLYITLNRMVSKRIISCKPAPNDKRYNIYSLPTGAATNCHKGDLSKSVTVTPDNYPPPPPPTLTDTVVDYYPETYTNSGFDNSLHNSLQPSNNSTLPKGIETYRNGDTATVPEIVYNFANTVGGGGEEGFVSVPVAPAELAQPNSPSSPTYDDLEADDLEAQYGYPPHTILDVEPTPMISSGHSTSTEPFADEILLPKTPLDELKEKLSQVTFWGAYRAATIGFLPEEIEAAIAAQSPEVQVRLQAWMQESSDENVRIE